MILFTNEMNPKTAIDANWQINVNP